MHTFIFLILDPISLVLALVIAGIYLPVKKIFNSPFINLMLVIFSGATIFSALFVILHSASGSEPTVFRAAICLVPALFCAIFPFSNSVEKLLDMQIAGLAILLISGGAVVSSWFAFINNLSAHNSTEVLRAMTHFIPAAICVMLFIKNKRSESQASVPVTESK
jgi:hypothetical protein